MNWTLVFWVWLCFDSRHPFRYEAISHYGFDCISLMTSNVEHLLISLLAVFCHLWRNVSSHPLPIFSSAWLFVVKVHAFFIYFGYYPLFQCVTCRYFSHSLGCLFILLMASFALQELIRLMYSHLFIFTFGAYAFGVKSKKSLPRLMSRSLLLSFSSRCFMASGLTLKSLIHFGLVVLFYSFVCDYPVFLIPRIEMIVKTVIYNSLSGNS